MSALENATDYLHICHESRLSAHPAEKQRHTKTEHEAQVSARALLV